MPKVDTIRKVIQRKRKEVSAAPAVPTDLTSLVIPDQYKTYEATPGHWEEFLLADTGPGRDRILIFGRSGNMQWSVI